MIGRTITKAADEAAIRDLSGSPAAIGAGATVSPTGPASLDVRS